MDPLSSDAILVVCGLLYCPDAVLVLHSADPCLPWGSVQLGTTRVDKGSSQGRGVRNTEEEIGEGNGAQRDSESTAPLALWPSQLTRTSSTAGKQRNATEKEKNNARDNARACKF